MDLFSSFSDDALAIGGCVFALLTTGILMSVSHTLNPKNRAKPQRSREEILTAAREVTESYNKAA